MTIESTEKTEREHRPSTSTARAKLFWCAVAGSVLHVVGLSIAMAGLRRAFRDDVNGFPFPISAAQRLTAGGSLALLGAALLLVAVIDFGLMLGREASRTRN